MRKFSLQAYDTSLNLIDEFNLDSVTSPSGLGFRQQLTTVATDTLDYIAHQRIEKDTIKLTVNFFNPNGYLKSRLLREWVGKHILSRCVLKYDDGEGRTTYPASVMYIDVQIEQLQISEIDVGINSVPLVLRALSPWYLKERKSIVAQALDIAKTFPYTYPYRYGALSLDVEDRKINNTFFKDIPLMIRIKGKVINPTLSLKQNGEIYTTIAFNNFTLNANEVLEINAIDRLVSYTHEGTTQDAYNRMDHTKDTFIYARPGESEIAINIDQTVTNADGSRPSVEVIYTQYVM